MIINRKTFEKSISLLQEAYSRGTLKSSSCAACAVGTLLAEVNDCYVEDEIIWKYKSDHRLYEGSNTDWYSLLEQQRRNGFDEEISHQSLLNNMKNTGYTVEQLSCIEAAFEGRNSPIDLVNRNLTMEDRLERVYDKLCEIHQVSLDERVDPKILFRL